MPNPPQHDPIGASPPGLNGNGQRAGKKTLAGIGVGTVAATLIYAIVPRYESGGREHLTAYQDVVGIWTICDGDTHNVRPGETDTPAQCRDRLERQLVAHAEPVMRCVPGLRAADRQYQLAASVSIAYNIGPGERGNAGFCHSSIARRFNAGDWRGGCDAFLLYNRAGGRVIRGLDVRRHDERAICLRGLT